MLLWTLYEFVSTGSSQGIVVAWREGIRARKLRVKVWSTFCARWRVMRQLRQDQWPPTWTKQLRGHHGIFEMRLKVAAHQYRPLFFFGPGRGDITFVFMADEVGDKFVPPDAPARAQRARADVMSRRREIVELEID